MNLLKCKGFFLFFVVFFIFFSLPLIVPFVPVSIISLFGLADFQLDAALLGAPAAQQEELQGMWGLSMNKRGFFPPKCSPLLSWGMIKAGCCGDHAFHGMWAGVNCF